MIQGTTPTILYNLPFSASLIKSAEITIKYIDNYKKILIKKELSDCELGETTISTMLTQEETLAIPAKSSVSVQLRILTVDDVAMATEVSTVTVKRLLAKDVIE